MTKLAEIEVLGLREDASDWELMHLKGLQDMQAFVRGYLECIRFPEGINLWVNKDFNFLDSEGPTLFIRQPGYDEFQIIYGNVFFASTDEEGNTVSLSPIQKEWIRKHTELLALKIDSSIHVVRMDLQHYLKQ